MFPIRDDNPTILTPYATYAIIVINAAAWILVQGMGSDPLLSRSVCELGLIPGALLGTVPPGTEFQISRTSFCVIGDTSVWYTPLTSMFMHGGWLHVIGNMWFMWVFGDNVEDSMGHVRFVVFYLLCGLTAAAVQMATNPGSEVPMVGASGAIGGVMGAYILLYPKVHVHMLIFFGFFITRMAVPAVWMLGYWFLIQLISGLGTLGVRGGGVAFWAHVGGFVGGMLLVLLFRNPELLDKHPYHGWRQRRSPTQSWHKIKR